MLEVLQRQQDHVKKQWNLELIVGSMAIGDIYAYRRKDSGDNSNFILE